MSREFNCLDCVHRCVCPAYMATQIECGDYMPDWCYTRDAMDQTKKDEEKPAP